VTLDAEKVAVRGMNERMREAEKERATHRRRDEVKAVVKESFVIRSLS